MVESTQQHRDGLVTWEILMDQSDKEEVPTQEEQYKLQKQLDNPVVFAASADPDTMYFPEAMRELDKDKSVEAMQKEIQYHKTNGHWEIVPKTKVLLGTKILDMVWAMKRKRHISTEQVYKWKAHLNIHRGQQEHGINYWETCAPIVNWNTLCLFFIHSIYNGWYNKQMDFILAYPHAPT